MVSSVADSVVVNAREGRPARAQLARFVQSYTRASLNWLCQEYFVETTSEDYVNDQSRALGLVF